MERASDAVTMQIMKLFSIMRAIKNTKEGNPNVLKSFSGEENCVNL